MVGFGGGNAKKIIRFVFVVGGTAFGRPRVGSLMTHPETPRW
jgi:hypothetical protein